VKGELVDHLRKSHQEETKELELLDVVDRCERATVGKQACPICSENLPPKWLRGHLARHMQQLALFALPCSDEKDDDWNPPTASGSGAAGDADSSATHWSTLDGSHLSFDSNPQGRPGEDFDQNAEDLDFPAPMSSITESVEYSVSPPVPTTEEDLLLERYRRVPNSKRVFSWILKARQPLTIEQLRIAVAINPYQCFLAENDDTPADNTSFLDSCDRLVAINFSGHVELVDPAMKESLLQSDLMAEADINIALACFTYLSFDIFKKQLNNEVEVEERETSFPFLRYAILHLSFHLKACDESYTAKAMKIFLGDPDSINSYNQLARRYGSSLMTDNTGAIHIAVLLGHMAMTLHLLAQGVALDTGDGHGRTPLHLATINGYDAVMRLLLEKGANIEAVDNDGRTSLHLAIRGGFQAVALLLIEKGANTEAVDNGGRTSLHLAIRGGLQAMSLLLIWKGANIEAFENGRTPLHLAIRNGLWAVALLLIEEGANIEAADSDDNAPLHLAILANAENAPTASTSLGKFQHISPPSSALQYAPFYTGGYASGDEYNLSQDSQGEMDFELDAESVRRSVPPVDYVSQPHEHLGDPQSGQHLQASQQTQVNRRLRGEAKPFNRVSKTGKSHFVTPAAACAGFRCTFTENGQPCSYTDTFKLPSAMRQVPSTHRAPTLFNARSDSNTMASIREHLISKHMEFSPFQCANCKRVFTRLALETRHLQRQDTGNRICPNEPQIGDKNYQARCSVRDVLWGIRTKQEEVDKAVLLIKICNSQLEGRKRRGAQRDPTSSGESLDHSFSLAPPRSPLKYPPPPPPPAQATNHPRPAQAQAPSYPPASPPTPIP